MARTEKQILAIMNRLDPEYKYRESLRAMILVEKTNEFSDDTALEILTRGLSHPVWRYAAIRRAGRNRTKRARLLKKDLICSNLQPAYWVAKGFSEEEAKAKALEIGRDLSNSFRTQKAIDNRLAVLKETGRKISDSHKARWQSLPLEVKAVEVERKVKVLKELSLRREPKHFNGKVEFWLDRGYSEEEAKQIISVRARRDLSYFIEKYGEVEGRTKYDEMRARRAKTWSEMPSEVRADINERRSKNGGPGAYNEKSIQKVDFLYFYAFCHELGIKYGITKHDSLNKRWPFQFIGEVICFDKYEPLVALKIERAVRSKFGKCKNETLNTSEFIPGISTSDFLSFYEECRNDRA